MNHKHVSAVAVIGRPQHGKTSFSRMLSELTGRKAGMTSRVILDFLGKLDGKEYGSDWHALVSPEEMNVLRKRMIVTGDALASLRPHIFSETLYNEGVTIVDGIRRKEELARWCEEMDKAGTPVHRVWINRPGTPWIEDNTTVTADMADTVITANDLGELRLAAQDFCKTINWQINERT